MAKPLLKWVGGKTQLLPTLEALIPKTEGRYFEPFIGGGAAFFHFAGKGRFSSAVINDLNPELVNLYTVVRDMPERLMGDLDQYPTISEWTSKQVYLEVRAHVPSDPIAKACRLIYLNKCCFNGLYRINKKGEFNVPWGNPKTPPKLYDRSNVLACSEALQGVEIRHGSFLDAVAQDVKAGDVVYFDPPYVPLNKTSSFTSYAGEFGEVEQRLLAQLSIELLRRGVTVVASNSTASLVTELYAGFEVHEVQARRSINSDASKRGPIGELILVGTPQMYETIRVLTNQRLGF